MRVEYAGAGVGERAVPMTGRCLHEIFADRARTSPEAVAVVSGDERVTYAELDASANAVAGQLQSVGIGPLGVVGLWGVPGVGLITGMLGILKAGGAYLPLDPAYPRARIRTMAADSGITTVVAASPISRAISDDLVQVVPVGAERPGAAVAGRPSAGQAAEGDLAYVVYTSGSTGTPKGVLVEHRNVVRLFEQTQGWFQFSNHDVWTLFHSASFDFSVWEIWGALLFGGRLVIVPSKVKRSPAALLTLLRHEGVTVLNQTPSAFPQLMAVDRDAPAVPESLRLVIFGGERLDLRQLVRWIERHGDERPVLVNMYGITETTVHVTYRRIRREDLAEPERSPIGAPIPDLEVHVLDEAGRAVPVGTPGELYVGGPGVARGYLNRPELTRERFAEMALVPGAEPVRLYRSGDLAVARADGELEYLGRVDGQLKVRGYRVEPAEVELVLSRHPDAATVMVTSRDFGEGDQRLVAYVVPCPAVLYEDRAEPLVDELRDLAAVELPVHMRPSSYEVVSEIPLTSQGKLDRAELAGRQVSRQGAPSPARAPVKTARRDAERTVAQIAKDVLRRRDIDIEDDLFDQGSTSLAFIRIVALVNEHFDMSLTGSELGDIASVSRLAAIVSET